MNTFEIHSLSYYDLKRITRILRKEQLKLILNLNKNPYSDLCIYANQSFYTKSWKINGKLAAIGGVTGSILSSEGFAWLALTEESLKFPIAIIKEIKIQLNNIMVNKNKINAYVFINDNAAQKFAEFFGFINNGAVDNDFYLYSLSKGRN